MKIYIKQYGKKVAIEIANHRVKVSQEELDSYKRSASPKSFKLWINEKRIYDLKEVMPDSQKREIGKL